MVRISQGGLMDYLEELEDLYVREDLLDAWQESTGVNEDEIYS